MCIYSSYSNVEFVVYDDACHLKKYCINPVRSGLSVTAALIAQKNIVVDKMHFKGHIDGWCHRHCNPNDFSELNNVRNLKNTCTVYNPVYMHVLIAFNILCVAILFNIYYFSIALAIIVNL